MKKCPFCKADIEDNARFCLYCMKPLNEKEVIPPQKKTGLWWLLPVVAALLLLGLLVAMLVRGENPAIASETTEAESTSVSQPALTQESQPPEDLAPSDDPAQDAPVPSDTQPPAGTANQTPAPNQNTPPQAPSGNSPVITPTPSPTHPNTTEPEKTEPEKTEPEETEPEQTEPEETEPEETEPEETEPEETEPEETEPPKTQAAYTYRAAQAGDDFNAHYQNTGNDIVITGIAQSAADGVYDIPAYIDGKKVIAILANAFSGSNAKTVYVPTTVKNIWNHAFAGCGLTDIYFRGNSLYAEGRAFPTGITIHCSASCSDRNFRYYKNSAVNYGATWAEWNG